MKRSFQFFLVALSNINEPLGSRACQKHVNLHVNKDVNVGCVYWAGMKPEVKVKIALRGKFTRMKLKKNKIK